MRIEAGTPEPSWGGGVREWVLEKKMISPENVQSLFSRRELV